MLNEKIIRICEQKLIYLNYSKNTIDNYISHIKKFLGIPIEPGYEQYRMFKKSLLELGIDLNKLLKEYSSNMNIQELKEQLKQDLTL